MERSGDILVIDDEQAIVDFVVELLQDEGYHVRSARNGAVALDTIAEQVPAMILVDMHMPQMSGETFVSRLQEQGLANIPVVLMTADALGAQKFVAGYPVDYIAKPFDLEHLLSCVTRYVGPPDQATPPNNSTQSHLV
jgi:CheY-like chemotaxis protein